MGRIIICVFLWSVMAVASVFSAEVNEIFLDDGSILRAEVVSLQDGVYSLRSESMGEFTLDASRVNHIGRRPEDQTAPLQAQPPSDFQAKVASTQAAILNDPEAMQSVMLLASDPEFKKLLEDPEAVAAIKSGDTATLLKNPRFQVIMNSPGMQGIAARLMNKTKDPQ